MKHLLKRSMAMVMTLLLVFSLLSGITFTADAATVNYQYGSTSKYSNVIKNWGIREEVATFLSPNAEAFYEDTTYEELIALNGSSNLTVVDTSALYIALNTLMKDAHSVTNSYEDTKTLMAFTDIQNNGITSNKISAFYSGGEVGPAWDSGSTWNREHTWPNSKGGASSNDGGGVNEVDIMMIRPETSSNNSSRGNKAYGESSGYFSPNLSSTYDVRGDAARTILYVYVRWGTEESEVLNNMWGTDGVFESKEVLLNWMKEDPVDTWEMGRNDSVESITGTRNVFVDYPELAFKLFNETVPQMTTPSGNAGGAAYTITARSNNTSYGTVSLSGNVITATPASGYYASGYSVTSGSATVTQNGNLFTVKATSNCTITINFALAPKYTVQVKENGSLKSTQSVQENTQYTLPEFTSSLPDENHTFLGWSTSELSNAENKPAVYAAGEKVTITADTTFHAVVAVLDPTVEGGTTTWNLVTSDSQIAAGDQVIIAAKDYDYAISTTQNSNNRGQAAITKSGNTLTYDSAVAVFTLEAGTISDSFAFNTGSGYLYAVNNSSNYLRTQTTKVDGASFYIAAESDGTCSITSAAYVSGTSGVGNVPMQYNSQNSVFACYPKATQNALSLYVAVSGMGATTYTTSWTVGDGECSHTNTTTTTTPASCTAPGSVTVTCADCGEIISTTVLPASHTEVETEIAPTLTQEGYTLLSCGVCGEELGKENYSNPLTNVEGWNLTLGSDLSMNFKVDVHESIRSTAQIHITVANDAKTYNVSELTVADDGYYYLSVKLAAVQMTDLVTVQITNGSDQTGIEIYSVQTYAETIITGDYPVELQDLMLQMLCYGAAAQIYFNYRVDSLPDVAAWGYEPGTPSTTNVYKVSGVLDGISFYGATMMFRDKNAVRFYFDVTGDVDSYTFTVNGKACTPVPKGDRYYIEYADINPQDLNNVITVKVNDTLSVTYSPMNYIVNMRQKGSEKLQELVQTLYDYHVAAVAYLAAN